MIAKKISLGYATNGVLRRDLYSDEAKKQDQGCHGLDGWHHLLPKGKLNQLMWQLFAHGEG